MNPINKLYLAGFALLASYAMNDTPEDFGVTSLPPEISAPPADQKSGSWVSKPNSYPGSPEIPQVDFWETQVTQVFLAERELRDKTIRSLSSEDALRYGGPHFRSPPGTRPYLVRGTWWNYTGSFSLILDKGDLHVRQDSLGHSDGEHKLPIIVNLESPPKRVFTYHSFAL